VPSQEEFWNLLDISKNIPSDPGDFGFVEAVPYESAPKNLALHIRDCRKHRIIRIVSIFGILVGSVDGNARSGMTQNNAAQAVELLRHLDLPPNTNVYSM
jgi:hypothetical protein